MQKVNSIWEELIARLSYEAKKNQQQKYYGYALSDQLNIYGGIIKSAEIIVISTSGQDYDEQIILEFKKQEKQELSILLIFDDNQDLIKFETLNQASESIQLNIRRNCDINDIWKNYICLMTNFKLPIPNLFENNLFYLSIKRFDQKEELTFKVMNGKIEEVTKFEGDQKKQKGKKSQLKQSSDIDLLQQLFKQTRNNYKDQIDEVGKILGLQHPIIITVQFLIPQNYEEILEGPHIYLPSVLDKEEQLFECVNYFKYDIDPKQILEDHLKHVYNQIKFMKQNDYQSMKAYYQDYFALPLIKIDQQFESLYPIPKLKLNINEKTRLLYQRHKFETVIPEVDGKLCNVHLYLSPKGIEGGKKFMIRGDYVFHHYLQDGFDDKGWGCAYRSFMSVYSWLIENHYTARKNIPTHKEIQQMLFQMGDKPQEFIGTSEWIGAFEVSMLLNKLTNYENKILHIQNGPEIIEKLNVFKQHFIQQGCPVMFGGGVYAYTLLGIDWNQQTNDVRFLILDPHYTASDNIKTVIDKGGVSWRKIDMFLPDTFYNFCLPQVE